MNVFVVIEAVTGLLLVALGTGISFARFARPRARILFSVQAVVAPYLTFTLDVASNDRAARIERHRGRSRI